MLSGSWTEKRMADTDFWELPSNSGREVSRWTVIETCGSGDERAYRCDIALEGQFYSEMFDSAAVGDLRDFGLVIHGLMLRHHELQRLVSHLREWLSLPPAELRDRSLDLTCGMGGLFDQSLRLALGQRDDTLSGGRPVATLVYLVGRMKGELSYPVDPSCLKIMADGIERILERAG